MFDKLRYIRNKRNISAVKMAYILGLKTPAAYYKKESGSIKFSLEEANIIAKFLQMQIEDIFFEDDISVTKTLSKTG